MVIFGCTPVLHTYYVPNTMNVPQMDKKDDFRLAGGVGATSLLENNGGSYNGNIQIAYALRDNIGIMGSFFSWGNYELGSDMKKYDLERGKYGDLGVGLFKPFYFLTDFVLEGYGGIGLGNEHHNYSINSYTVNVNNPPTDLNYAKFFLQASLGLNGYVKRYFYEPAERNFSISGRLSVVNFYKVNYITDPNLLVNNATNADLQANSFSKTDHNPLLLELALTDRIGWKKIKWQYQILYAAKLSQLPSKFIQNSLGFSLGLFISINNEKNNFNGKFLMK